MRSELLLAGLGLAALFVLLGSRPAAVGSMSGLPILVVPGTTTAALGLPGANDPANPGIPLTPLVLDYCTTSGLADPSCPQPAPY